MDIQLIVNRQSVTQLSFPNAVAVGTLVAFLNPQEQVSLIISNHEFFNFYNLIESEGVITVDKNSLSESDKTCIYNATHGFDELSEEKQAQYWQLCAENPSWLVRYVTALHGKCVEKLATDECEKVKQLASALYLPKQELTNTQINAILAQHDYYMHDNQVLNCEGDVVQSSLVYPYNFTTLAGIMKYLVKTAQSTGEFYGEIRTKRQIREALGIE